MPKLSFTAKRVFVGIALCVCALCIANYYLDFGVFGRFKRDALILSFILLAIVMRYLGPTLQEMRDYRDSKRAH